MTLLIDLSALSEHQTNDALEAIHKSIHDHGGDSAWNPHESPYIQRLIELFTERGLTRLEAFRKELTAWAEGERHQAQLEPVARPEGMMRRWDQGELSLVKLYLQALSPDEFTLDDWGMVVDYLVQRYLPEDQLRTEAEWLATRSGLMGKVQANYEHPLTLPQADKLIAAMPNTVKAATEQFKLNPVQHSILDYGRARAAEAVTRLSDNVRHKMRDVIMQHEEEKMFNGGAAAPGSALKTRLIDEFAVMNRDWRRIAITEAGETANQGFIASMKPGTRLKRIEQYDNACSFCRSIHGAIVQVVSPDAPNKDPDTQVWVGKSNVGRSLSPRKRVNGELIERLPDERWWMSAGVMHPHCRGVWAKLPETEIEDDPDFALWLEKTLRDK